jgi:ribosomal protein L11 methyltransferase
MARHLAGSLAPGGTAILAGLLTTQVRWVLGAHRAQGLVLERVLEERGDTRDEAGAGQRHRAWATLVLRKK